MSQVRVLSQPQQQMIEPMKLLSIINRSIGVLCAVLSSFCLGYAIASGMNHVFFTAALFAVLAYCCFAGNKADRKYEQEKQRRASHE